MPRMEIYDETKPIAVEPIRLRLKENARAGITVVAVDARGHELAGGNLVTFQPNGTLLLEPCVNSRFRFELTDSNRIKTV